MDSVSSQGELDLPPRKRRRTALSCFNCRRRKLQCDRDLPSCSRCRKTGLSDTCGYDHHSPMSAREEISVGPITQSGDNHTNPSGEDLTGLGANSRLMPPNTPSESAVARTGGYSVVRADSSSIAQPERIQQLENRIIGLESLVNDPPRRTNQCNSPERQPVVQRAGAHLTSESRLERIMEGRTTTEGGTILKGQHFETRFNGISHSSSLLGQVLYTVEPSRVQ